jgi:hypothetical protein
MPAATETPSEHWHKKMYTSKNNKGKNKRSGRIYTENGFQKYAQS